MTNYKFNKIPRHLKATNRGRNYEVFKIDVRTPEHYEKTNAYLTNTLTKSMNMKSGYLYQVVYKINGRWFSTDGFKDYNANLVPALDHYNDIEILGDELVTAVRINRIKVDSTGGGYDDIHNNCLFFAIKFGLSDKWESVLPKYPSNFKKWVGVGVDDLIDYKSIPIIEKRLKIRINVSGDYEYISAFDYPKVVCVELKDGHYRFKNNMKIRNQLVKYKKHDRIFTYFELHENFIRTYDGVNVVDNYELNSDELIMSKTHTYRKNIIQKGDIKENYDTFMLNAQHLFDMTGIQLSDQQYNVKDTALAELYKYTKMYEMNPIDEEEARWINKCKNCGLMYCCEPSEGELNVFDVNSFYPSIMVSKQFLMPYCKPIYEVISEKPEFGWKLGIYRAKISGGETKLFMTNPENHYTNIEMIRADELGYTIEIIQDGLPNMAYYKQRINGNLLFEGFINQFYKFKTTINPLTNKSNPLIKEVMNSLWGGLCQRDKEFKNDDYFETINPEFVTLTEGHNGKDLFEIVKGYKRNHARIGIFLTATGRVKMSKIIEPIKDEVYRVHTDGLFTTAETIDNIGSGIGQLKLEKSGVFEIIHLNSIKKL